MGAQVGTTVMNIWLPAVGDKTKEAVLSYVVRVAPDPDAKDRLERAYKALEGELGQTFPRSAVQVKLVGDAIVLAGQAPDPREAELIVRVVVANTPEGARHAKIINLLEITGGQPAIPMAETREQIAKRLEDDINRAFPDGQVQLTVVGGALIATGYAHHRREAQQVLSILGNSLAANKCAADGPLKVIDRLRIYGAEQIMLKVMIAEVNRTAATKMNACFDLSQQAMCVDKGRALSAIQTLKRLSCARTLAEPTLVTLDGQTAKFDSGGQFVLPASAGGTLIPYGVQLAFTPTILDKDHIRLEVSAGLSSREAAANLSSRGFSSTVELSENQTLAVAGLIQSSSAPNRNQLPFLGAKTEEQELVILITPEIVRPAAPQELPR